LLSRRIRIGHGERQDICGPFPPQIAKVELRHTTVIGKENAQFLVMTAQVF